MTNTVEGRLAATRSCAVVCLALGAAITAASAWEAPAVEAVYPSGPTIPENILRLSIRFAMPPAHSVLPEIRLRKIGGSVIDDAFLDQELWSSDGAVLTVLFLPGRVKTALIAHDTLGRAVVAGEAVELLVSGRPVKSWNVEFEKRTPPDPVRWNLQIPKAASVRPLRVAFEAPIDALAANLIAVAGANGSHVAGHATLTDAESVWTFAPTQPWDKGKYTLRVHPRLEDVGGNEVGQPFERPIDAPAPEANPLLELPFSIE
jgi:hypothetical protein